MCVLHGEQHLSRKVLVLQDVKENWTVWNTTVAQDLKTTLLEIVGLPMVDQSARFANTFKKIVGLVHLRIKVLITIFRVEIIFPCTHRKSNWNA